jgi:hypothetical protein
MDVNKMTAVEWLEIQLKKGIDYNPLELSGYTKAVDKVFEHAKLIEKHQIIKAVDVGFEEGSKFIEDIKLNNAEQYYNETYGGEK